MRIESNGYTVKDIFGLGDGSIKISARGEVFTFDTETIEVVNGEFSSTDFDLLLEAMTAAKRKADQIQEMLKRDEPATIPTVPATPTTGYVGKPIDSAVMLDVLADWINIAKENHDAMGHRRESLGAECWTRFTDSDIRAMIANAERETAVRLGVAWDAVVKASA